MPEFRKKINLIDVGPRDGFQNVRTFIETQTKLAIIDGIYKAGIRDMEVTSFVSPKAIPQMADAAEVARKVIDIYPDMRVIALVPNLRGAQNAWDAGIREAACVISASEAHNKANINRTIQESIKGLAEMIRTFPGLKVRLDVATAFGCPFAGKVPEEDVLYLIGEAAKAGVDDVTLCDTIGVANPKQVQSLVKKVKEEFPRFPLALHFHNTRGMGLANIFAAIEVGVEHYETSVGGLGGCPFAPGSEGNTATEDTVNMLGSMGYETGVNLEKLLEAVQYTKEHVEAPLTGKMLGVTASSCANVSGKA